MPAMPVATLLPLNSSATAVGTAVGTAALSTLSGTTTLHAAVSMATPGSSAATAASSALWTTLGLDDYSVSGDYEDDYVTLIPPEDPWAGLNQAVSTLYFLVFLLGFLGNVFVLCVLGWSRGGGSGGRLVDTFVRHLAVADLVFVGTLPLWAVSASAGYRWDFGQPLCRLSSAAVAVNRVSNVAFLACMSADRYLAVVRRLDSRLVRSGGCVRLTCALVWTLAVALGAPALVFRRVDERGLCVDPEDSPAFQAYSLLMVLLAFALPVGVISLCYGAICLHLQRHCALTAAHHPRAQAHARRRHTLKIVLAIVTAFVASWLPFSVCRATLAVAKLTGTELGDANRATLGRAMLLSSCLAFVNSCANPAIYLLLDRHFRRRAARLVCQWQRRRHGNRAHHDSLSSPTGESISGSTHTRSRLTSLNLKT
ncbi:probable G-protein coupled receptor 25 [Sardina pilchardus]|uniref:probable G-protein coupled receptor 25 n=1 Tax=Sardina pilchardus TaxID=27697 RepID=UPI002E101AC2